jgi:hypothetical protein
MVEAVIMALIYICLIVLVVYVAFWVLTEIGVGLPAQVTKIVWIVVALICLLLIVRVLLPPLKLGALAMTLIT